MVMVMVRVRVKPHVVGSVRVRALSRGGGLSPLVIFGRGLSPESCLQEFIS